MLAALLTATLAMQGAPAEVAGLITDAREVTRLRGPLLLASGQTLDCGGRTLRFESRGIEIRDARDVTIRNCRVELPVPAERARALLIRNSQEVTITDSRFQGGWSVATVNGVRALRMRNVTLDSGKWDGQLDEMLRRYDAGDVDRRDAATNTHALIFESGPAEDVLLDGLTVYAFGLDLGVGQLNNWRGTNDITLINSTIYGGNHQVMNYRGQGAPQDRSLITSASTRLIVRNNRLYYGVENAIYHRSVQGAIYENNFIERANVIGPWEGASATNAAISARQPASTPGRPDLDRSQPLIIRGNTILNPGRRGTGTLGIVIRVDRAIVEDNVLIRESHFDEERLGTAVAGGEGPTVGHAFRNNRVVNWNRGFHLDWTQGPMPSSEGTIYEGNQFFQVNRPLFVMGSTGGVIRNNVIYDAEIGVSLWRFTRDWIVEGNTFERVRHAVETTAGPNEVRSNRAIDVERLIFHHGAPNNAEGTATRIRNADSMNWEVIRRERN